jgi:hypothetical protein
LLAEDLAVTLAQDLHILVAVALVVTLIRLFLCLHKPTLLRLEAEDHQIQMAQIHPLLDKQQLEAVAEAHILVQPLEHLVDLVAALDLLVV